MAHQRRTCIFNSAVSFDHEFDHSQEHKVLNLTLFLKLLYAFLLLSSLGLLCFNLLLNFCSLLLSQALLLVPLLLSLGGCQIVSWWLPSAPPCRTMRLAMACVVLSTCGLVVIAVLIHVLNPLKVIFVAVSALIFLLLVVTGGLSLAIVFLLITWLRSASLSLIVNAHVFAELCETDLAVGIVVASSQDSLLVISTREEGIPLQEVDQIRHLDSLASSRDGIKGPYLDEFWATGQLSLALVSRSLQLHLLLKEARE